MVAFYNYLVISSTNRQAELTSQFAVSFFAALFSDLPLSIPFSWMVSEFMHAHYYLGFTQWLIISVKRWIAPSMRQLPA